MRRLLIPAAAMILCGPLLALPVVAVLLPGPTATCTPSTRTVGTVPAALETTAGDGSVVRLDRRQLGHAATIITVGTGISGVGDDGLLVALMAALTESRLLMYANTSAYPESARYPHDADGSDHDSLGLFQMRPAAGWGTVAQLMDPVYQARAFFGGPTGPNRGSPRGLLDIPDWRALPKGAAAQAVEVSAYPDRYARYEPVARKVLTTLTQPTKPSGRQPSASSDRVASPLPPVRDTVFPLPAGTWTRTSGYGMRRHPTLGIQRLHAGVDLAGPAGTPVLATAAGLVVVAEHRGGLGNHVILEHRTNDQFKGGKDRLQLASMESDAAVVATVYGHLADGSTTIHVGDQVAAGQHIADVGSTGNSSGPHLHFELRPGGAHSPAVDPDGWLAATNEATTDRHAAPAALDTCQAVAP